MAEYDYKFTIKLKTEDLTKKPIEIVEHIMNKTSWHWADFEVNEEHVVMRYDVSTSGLIDEKFEKISELIWDFMECYAALEFHVYYMSEIPEDNFYFGQKEFDNFFEKKREAENEPETIDLCEEEEPCLEN